IWGPTRRVAGTACSSLRTRRGGGSAPCCSRARNSFPPAPERPSRGQASWGRPSARFPPPPAPPAPPPPPRLRGPFTPPPPSMAQTLVQLLAPARVRGKVVGLFNTAALGLRAGSGLTVGLLGALIGVQRSLELSAAVVVASAVVLLAWELGPTAGGAAEELAA